MSSIEQILAKVLEPDNEAIKTGTMELREAMKDPTIIPTLLQVGKFSANPQIRQYSLVLLRKRLSKSYHYGKLTSEYKQGIKNGILEAYSRETESFVRNAVAQLIGCVARHELHERKWPELVNFLQNLCCQGSIQDRELGLFALSVIAEAAGEEFKPYLKPFVSVFHSALQDAQSPSAYHATITLKNFILHIGSEEATMIQPLIPKVVVAVKKLVKIDETKAVSAMEIWEELLESELSMLAPHLKVVSELCLDVATNKELGDAIRVKALHFLSSLARLKKKAMMKNKLIAPTLQAVFAIMSESDGDEDEDDDEDQTESSKPSIVAAQTLNEMALHLPPDRVVTPLLQWAEPAVTGTDLKSQAAAYLALAVIAEGCAEHIRTKYLPAFVQCICNGIKHPQPFVRNAALYAVGQFSEHLQPDINKYANDILPVLFGYLSATCNSLASGQKVPRSIDRVFYALEMFCETMEDKLNPFVPALMEHFFAALNPNYPVHVKELALSAIGATANAVGTTMTVFFSAVMEHLKTFLTGDLSEEEMPLQVQALDTLGVIARTIGEETFLPFAEECLHFTLNLAKSKDNPDLRKCAYGVFASVSTVLKDNMSPALPFIIELLLKAVESNEGVTPHKESDDDAALLAADVLNDEEDLSPMDDEDEDDEDVAGYTVENAYLEEKEEACLALKELAANSGGAFFPYVKQCSGPVLKLVDYGHEDVRQAAVGALGQFTICIGKHPEGEQSSVEALNILIPKLSEVINTDTEMEVVCAAFDTLTDVLKELKGAVLKAEGHTEAIIMCIRNVFNKATQCQMMDQAEEGHPEDDDLEEMDSEASEKLIEYAGDALPAFGSAMTPQEFAPYFAGLLPSILQKTKKHCTVAERSFSIGLLAVCIEPLSGVLEPFIQHLFPAFTNLMRDDDCEVRNNAIFGLGELVFHAKDLLFSNYPQILQNLSNALSREDNNLALDNICAALARLILTNINGVPMDQVFPALMKHLPLREDFHEYTAILKCFIYLFENGHVLFSSYVPQYLNVILHMVVHKKKLEPEQVQLMTSFARSIVSSFPDVYNEWVSKIEPNLQQELSQIQF